MQIAFRVGIETAITVAALAPLIAIGMWSSRSRASCPFLACVALFAFRRSCPGPPEDGAVLRAPVELAGKLLEVAWVLALAAIVRGYHCATSAPRPRCVLAGEHPYSWWAP